MLKSRTIYILLFTIIISGLQGLSAAELEFWQEKGVIAAISLNDFAITLVALNHKKSLMEKGSEELPILEINDIELLIDMVKGDSFNDRYPAALTLSALGPLSAEETYRLAQLSSAGDAAIRYYAALALEGSAPLSAETVYPFINASLNIPDYREELLFEAIYLSGGDEQVVKLIRLMEWEEKLTGEQLVQLDAILEAVGDYPALRQRFEQLKEENKGPNPVIFRILLLVIATVAIFVVRKLIKR